jgi:hypothetical protein
MILRNGKFSGKNIAENFPYGKIFHLTSLVPTYGGTTAIVRCFVVTLII